MRSLACTIFTKKDAKSQAKVHSIYFFDKKKCVKIQLTVSNKYDFLNLHYKIKYVQLILLVPVDQAIQSVI